MIVTIDSQETCDEPSQAIEIRRRRIDSPHETAVSESMQREPALLEVEEPTAEMLAVVTGESIEAQREQMQLQVAQLAGHLRERLLEVDRREAAIHARAGQLEADVRASRLWVQEREAAFQERENELRRRIEELEEQSVRAPVSVEFPEPAAMDHVVREAELDEREHTIQLQEDGLRERRFEVDRQAAALRHAQQLWEQQREREERQLASERERAASETQQLSETREEQLRAAEVLLSEHVQKLERDEAVFLEQRRSWEELRVRQRQAVDELRRAAEAEMADCRTRLEARQEWIERQKQGLTQVRDEALKLHRQSLEMRLMAEQLWSQISGALAPAEVTQAIAQMRVKLAEQYRLEEEQLGRRREELVALGERVAEQHGELTQLRTGLREWAAARQVEIESQAATLVERELALDAQQDEVRRAEREWQASRRNYEQQIRDLTTQVRTLPVAA